MADTSYICLLTQGDECCVCGGWLHRERRGGYEGPAGRMCAADELDDALEMATWGRRNDWCPTCGYDNHEHAPDCADHARQQEETGG
jgi:hypothetical protein